MLEQVYINGEYLKKHPEWHVEESAWKAKNISNMLTRHHITPKTICEVGCGAGEVLRQLQERMNSECTFWGYDVSPQAIELAQPRANERLHFKLGDIAQEKAGYYDLILVLDVIEHLEDYFSFLRAIKPRSDYKIFHLPLDIAVQRVLRSHVIIEDRKAHGHIHYFNKEIALEMLKDVGYEVLDYCYTAPSIELPTEHIRRRLLRLPRKLLFKLNPDLAVRILGGWRLLILAK